MEIILNFTEKLLRAMKLIYTLEATLTEVTTTGMVKVIHKVILDDRPLKLRNSANMVGI